MGATTYPLPESSGVIAGTVVENIITEYRQSKYGTGPGGIYPPFPYEKVEEVSELGKYRGGNLLGWDLFAPEKAKIIIYDNNKEAKGENYGPISLNENESIRDWFPSGLRFKNGLFLEIIEGEIEGCVFADCE